MSPFTSHISEKTAELIDNEVRKLIEEAYAKTKEMLLERSDDLERVAKELLEKEIIFKTDLVALLGPRPFDKLDAYDEYMNSNSSEASTASTDKVENDSEENLKPEEEENKLQLMGINILSPRERILKEVRASLLRYKNMSTPTSIGAIDPFRIKETDDSDELLLDIGKQAGNDVFICQNKYHFLDQLMIQCQHHGVNSVVNVNRKMSGYFDSCGLSHQDNSEMPASETIAILPCDYWEPYGLFVSFDYSGSLAEILRDYAKVMVVGFRDQMVKGPQLLFERVKNRLSDADLGSVQLFSLGAESRTGEGMNI